MPITQRSKKLVPEKIRKCQPTDIRAKGKATAQDPVKATAKALAKAEAKAQATLAAAEARGLLCPQKCKSPRECQDLDIADHGSGLTWGSFRRAVDAAGNPVWQITAYAFELIHHECRCR